MDPSRTAHADQAVQLSELVRVKFATQRFGSIRRRFVRLMEPDVPSTDGGRKARQSIVLLPEDGEPGGVIVCGWVDSFRRVAELKSHPIVAQAYQERYGLEIDVNKTEYQRLLDGMFDFLRPMQIEPRLAHAQRGRTLISERPAPAPPAPPAWRNDNSERFALVAGGALLGFSLCYALFALGVL